MVQTAFTRQLGARIEAGCRRAGRPVRSPEDHSGMTVGHILQRGRLRASEQALFESTQRKLATDNGSQRAHVRFGPYTDK